MASHGGIRMKAPKIYLAGHTGLVGSNIRRELDRRGYRDIILRSHCELDLTDLHQVRKFFSHEKPDVVILAAAKVGGILANSRFPVQFLETNLSIQQNVLSSAAASGVEHLIFLGSSCIYPRDCEQPIKEEYLLTGQLEPTNRAYALAKISGIELCEAYNKQYGTKFLSLMPTNLYGIGDNYSAEESHVIPGLIRRIHQAKEEGQKEVAVWGSGSPKREFLYCSDLADACVFVLENMEVIFEYLKTNGRRAILNVGSSEELTIEETARAICREVGFDGQLVFDQSKPDGTPRKILSTEILSKFGWAATTRLESGLRAAYRDFQQRYVSQEFQKV